MTIAMTRAPIETAERSRSHADIGAVVAGLAVMALAAFSPTTLNDGDSWWHVTAGKWILAHGSVPHTDPFSFSMAGATWTAHEWLSEVFLALAFRLAGWSGVVLLTGAAAGLAAFFLTRRLSTYLEGSALLIVTLLGLSLMGPGLLARPHVLALPLLVIWSVGLLEARDEKRAPSLAVLPLMTIWANMHGGFALGLALAGVFALEALIGADRSERLTVLRSWALFGAMSGGAALLTPHGLEGLLFPLKLLGMKSLAFIGEWKPSDFSSIGPLEIALMALLGFTLLKPLTLPPMRLALLLGLLHLALSHARHKMVLGALAPMLLAEPIARALAGSLAGPLASPLAGADPPLRARPASRAAILALATGFLILTGVRVALPVTRAEGAAAPISALAAVPPALRNLPVLNGYDFGGYLIASGVKPFIDGRADLYGDAMMADYDAISAGRPAAVEAALAKYGIAWTIFNPSQPVVTLLDGKPEWRRLYADRFAVVHVRNGVLPP